MKFTRLIFIFSGFAFWAAAGSVQAEDKSEIPPGMEILKVGETKILIPKGTKITKKAAQLVLEPPEQFWSRRVEEMEEEIARLKEETERMKADIEKLKEAVSQKDNKSIILK